MVSFSNIADLRLNFGPALERVGASFGERQQREEQTRLAKLKAVDIEDAFDAVQSPDKATRQQGLLTIARLKGPVASRQVADLLDRGTDQEIEAARVEAEKDLVFNIDLESALKGIENEGKRAGIISEATIRAGLTGQDLEDATALLNKGKDEQDTIISSTILSVTPAKELLEIRAQEKKFEQEQAAALSAPATLSPGQQRIAGGQVIAQVAPKAPAPTTAIGKARQDRNAGLITQSEFDTIQNAPVNAQSTIGKLIADKQAAVSVYGENSEQVKAIQSAIDSEAKDDGVKLSDIGGVRKEFTQLSGDFIKLRDAIGKVEQNFKFPSAAGDLSMIFNFMKILDPGSVVRESEFATAQNAAGVPERIRAQYNRVINGERLSKVTRKDFFDTANRLFKSQEDKQKQLERSFTAIAKAQGIDPKKVIIDFKVAKITKKTDNNKDLTKLSDAEFLKSLK